MGIYCKAGETARITLPNEILEFPAPVDIECKNDAKCYKVNWFCRVQRTNNPNNGTNFSGTTSATYRAPFSNRVTRDSSQTSYYIDHKCGAIFIGTWSLSFEIVNYGFTLTESPCNTTNCAPFAGITIKDINGAILYQDTTNGCDFNVECLNCPPNSLDCGDCCLDCADTFNQISAIRNLLNSLK